MQPLISITWPNYNHGRFLVEAFESLLSQTYSNFEILFTEDGSTDDSRKIAEEFAARDSRIKAVFFEKNQGVLAAHGNAWARVTGPLVYQFSSDDAVCDRDFFRLAVEALDEYPQAAGFFGGMMTVSDETGINLGLLGGASKEGFIDPTTFLKGFLTQNFFVPGISAIWRKAEIDLLGGYDHRLGPQTDYFINHALPARNGVVFKSRIFARARVATRKTSYSSAVGMKEEMDRMDLFAAKMRETAWHLGNMDAEWKHWRRIQEMVLQAKHSR